MPVGLQKLKRKARALVYACGLILLVGLGFCFASATWAAPAAQQDQNLVYVLTFDSAVTPVLQQYIQDAIAAAVENRAQAVIIQLDTPGGSLDITKSITQKMLASPVPIVVYVTPAGAHAGSAGTFITLAAHVAAMAPGTSIGAASPVGSSGQDIGTTMEAKVKNILSADIENLTRRRGEKATQWAIGAVQEAHAATAQQAHDLGVIDFVASDVPDLLNQMDGFQVRVNGQTRTLHTARPLVQSVPLTPLQQFLNFISDPTIASILLSLGILGLIIELRTPGINLAGIVGAICLVLAFYALGQLEANLAGLALIAVAFALLLAELHTPAFGVLALGGVVAFVLGAALLFNSPATPIPWVTIVVSALVLGGITAFAGGKALTIQRKPVMTGIEGLIGRVATAKASFQAGEPGSVFVAGEWWSARLEDGSIKQGEQPSDWA